MFFILPLLCCGSVQCNKRSRSDQAKRIYFGVILDDFFVAHDVVHPVLPVTFSTCVHHVEKWSVSLTIPSRLTCLNS